MIRTLLIAWMALLTTLTGSFAADSDEFWGQWRGPNGLGIATKGKPPTEWSENKNVRWKRELPGEGVSTPIVWGDRIYMQMAIPVNGATGTPDSLRASSGDRDSSERDSGDDRSNRSREGREGRQRSRTPTKLHKFAIMALERKTGKPVWEQVVCEATPHEGHHRDGGLASASPATDGKHVYAYFGSRGLYCLTMEGKLVWKKDFGDMRTRNAFGEGSSPVLHGDAIVVNWDHEDDSFIVALEKTTGKEKWRRNRDEATSWSTPLVIRDKGRAQVVVSATNRMRSYDLSSGELVWECGGLGSNCVASPVAGSGLIYAMSGHRDPALLAVRYSGAKGDLTGSDAVVWQTDTGTPYVPSPLLYGDALYFAQKNSEILSCYNAQMGKPYYAPQRLEELKGLYASLVGADGCVYIVGRNGATCVIKQGSKFEVLAVNKLDDHFTASPAIAGQELYLRGHKFLYCIASE